MVTSESRVTVKGQVTVPTSIRGPIRDGTATEIELRDANGINAEGTDFDWVSRTAGMFRNAPRRRPTAPEKNEASAWEEAAADSYQSFAHEQ